MKLKILQAFFLLIAITAHSAMAQDFTLPPAIPMQHDHFRTAIRLWGWSRNGKVAYSIEGEMDGTGDYYNEFFIMDMITDEIIFQFDDAISYVFGPPKLKEAIANTMRVHGIESVQSDFLSFPFRKDNFEYDCFVKTEYLPGSEELYDSPEKYDVVVSRNGKNKIIRTNSNPTAFLFGVCGYFMSPFENRVLIVTYNHYLTHGYAAYILSGCHLGVGFE